MQLLGHAAADEKDAMILGSESLEHAVNRLPRRIAIAAVGAAPNLEAREGLTLVKVFNREVFDALNDLTIPAVEAITPLLRIGLIVKIAKRDLSSRVAFHERNDLIMRISLAKKLLVCNDLGKFRAVKEFPPFASDNGVPDRVDCALFFEVLCIKMRSNRLPAQFVIRVSIGYIIL